MRFIGITHRVKRTAEGEARPTLVCVIDGASEKRYELATETDELDFLFGRFPVAYRGIVDGDDLTKYLERQLKTGKDKVTGEKKPTKLPIEFDGLKAGDTVAMMLGGSGGYLAYAMERQCWKLGEGAKVVRLTPKQLSDRRGDGDKKDDAVLLARLAKTMPAIFTPMLQVDMDQIRLQLAWRDRTDAMKDRIACEQRLYQRLTGKTFVAAELAPERSLEDEFLKQKADDQILGALQDEEAKCVKAVEEILYSLPAQKEIFEKIKGCGPMIAARLVVAIGDIRRFATDAKLKKFCGVAVTPDGKFPRRRTGEVANWQPEARQALYLLGDQFNRRPESVWGKELLKYKAKFQAKYPEPIVGENGKKKYTKAHIHRMATWRTLTKFVEWLWREWTRAATEGNGGDNVQAA